MAALRRRCGHYIFLLFLPSSFFPRLISASQNGCLPYFDTWCGLSANLECRSETCCTRLAGNVGPKNSPQNHHLGTIAQFCRAISLQLRHVSTIEKKLLSSNISCTCPHNMVNFDPLAAEIDAVVWGTPANFNGFASWQRYYTALQYWASAILCGVEQRAPPIFGRAAITLGIGPHSSCHYYGRPG